MNQNKFGSRHALELRSGAWLPFAVKNLKKSNPESVPEDKNNKNYDGPRSGSNKQNEEK